MLSKVRQRVRRPSAGTVLGSTALVLAMGGVGYAAIPGSAGQIHACYLDSGQGQARQGQVRLVDAGEQCKVGETAIAWNQEGPRGEPGLPGADGKDGVDGNDGVTNYYFTDRGANVSSNKEVAGVELPAGEYVLTVSIFALGSDESQNYQCNVGPEWPTMDRCPSTDGTARRCCARPSLTHRPIRCVAADRAYITVQISALKVSTLEEPEPAEPGGDDGDGGADAGDDDPPGSTRSGGGLGAP